VSATALAYIMYALCAAGGLAIYLVMPGRQRPSRMGGLIIGLGAVIGLMMLLSQRFMAPHPTNFFFYLFGATALLAAGRVVTHPKPVYSAVYFGLVILSVAVLVVIQRAEFLAVALVIIYAGAILVTYAFVIMLAQQHGESPADWRPREPLLAIVLAFVATGAIAGRIADLDALADYPQGIEMAPRVAEAPVTGLPLEQVSNTERVGAAMFGKYIVAVEMAGMLLLVAMVGAIAIARKKVPADYESPPPPPVGQIGREAPPF